MLVPANGQAPDLPAGDEAYLGADRSAVDLDHEQTEAPRIDERAGDVLKERHEPVAKLDIA